MRVKPCFCILPVTLAVVVILCSGCTRSQSPRYYALNQIQEDQVTFKRKSSSQKMAIGIGPVKVADYLDQSRLVTRTSDNQVVKAEYERWIGSFKDDFINVLADNIGYLLPTTGMYLYPWRQTVPVDYQVALDVIRCDGRLGEDAWLVVRWSVFGGEEKKLLKTNRSSLREPVEGADYSDLVAAQSRALAKLSQEIAAAIQGAGRN
jgi:uncharacterized protein